MTKFRTCVDCNNTHPLTGDHFVRNRSSRCGFVLRCKVCTSVRRRVQNTAYERRAKMRRFESCRPIKIYYVAERTMPDGWQESFARWFRDALIGPCEPCSGNGRVPTRAGSIFNSVRCQRCYGDGFIRQSYIYWSKSA